MLKLYYSNAGTQEIIIKTLTYTKSIGVHRNEKKAVENFF